MRALLVPSTGLSRRNEYLEMAKKPFVLKPGVLEVDRRVIRIFGLRFCPQGDNTWFLQLHDENTGRNSHIPHPKIYNRVGQAITDLLELLIVAGCEGTIDHVLVGRVDAVRLVREGYIFPRKGLRRAQLLDDGTLLLPPVIFQTSKGEMRIPIRITREMEADHVVMNADGNPICGYDTKNLVADDGTEIEFHTPTVFVQEAAQT